MLVFLQKNKLFYGIKYIYTNIGYKETGLIMRAARARLKIENEMNYLIYALVGKNISAKTKKVLKISKVF